MHSAEEQRLKFSLINQARCTRVYRYRARLGASYLHTKKQKINKNKKTNTKNMTYLVLIRHGESKWNLENKFTGWVDVPLSEKGIKEAQRAAEKLKKINFDEAYTSKLIRAQQTLTIILSKQKKIGIKKQETEQRKKWSNHPKQEHIKIIEAQELNERYYGELQGLNKEETKKKYGEEQVFKWRRSYDIRPPKGESLKDVYKRATPYFKKKIIQALKKQKDVLIAAHGNSLRAIIKHIEKIPDKEIAQLELETGKPIIYKYEKGKLIKK